MPHAIAPSVKRQPIRGQWWNGTATNKKKVLTPPTAFDKIALVMQILGIDTNAKTVKGQQRGYMTAISYLAPSDASGEINTCANASEGCRAACLFTSGRGRMSPVMQARVNKTIFFARDRETYMAQLKKETAAFIKRAKKRDLIPCERLNGTSDLPWHKIKIDGASIMEHFPELQFYDYTKSLSRMVDWCNGKLPKNYHLTFSRSEDTSDSVVRDLLKRGANVAVVYAGALPVEDFGAEVINGDESDLRFRDPMGKIVGLLYKANVTAIHDAIESGFVLANRSKLN